MTPAVTPSGAEIANLLVARLRQIGDVTEKGGMRGLQLGAIFSVNEIKRSLSQPHSGPIYGGRSPNPASLPGEPPALQQGTLRASYRWWPGGPNTIIVGSDDPKAPFLEHGTSRMSPRPHMRPGIAKALPQVVALLKKEAASAQREAVAKMRS